MPDKLDPFKILDELKPGWDKKDKNELPEPKYTFKLWWLDGNGEKHLEEFNNRVGTGDEGRAWKEDFLRSHEGAKVMVDPTTGDNLFKRYPYERIAGAGEILRDIGAGMLTEQGIRNVVGGVAKRAPGLVSRAASGPASWAVTAGELALPAVSMFTGKKVISDPITKRQGKEPIDLPPEAYVFDMLLGGGIGMAATGGAVEGVRRLTTTPAGREGAQDVIDLYRRFGTRPTAAAALQSRPWSIYARAVSRSPHQGPYFDDYLDQLVEGIRETFERDFATSIKEFAPSTSPSKYAVGKRVMEGMAGRVDDFTGNRVGGAFQVLQKQIGEMYNEVEYAVPRNFEIPWGHTKMAIEDAVKSGDIDHNLFRNVVKEALGMDAIEAQGVWTALREGEDLASIPLFTDTVNWRRMRTDQKYVGERIYGPNRDTSEYFPTQRMESIRTAMKADLEDGLRTLEQNGRIFQGAVNQWEDAHEWYQFYRTQQDLIMGKLEKISDSHQYYSQMVTLATKQPDNFKRTVGLFSTPLEKEMLSAAMGTDMLFYGNGRQVSLKIYANKMRKFEAWQRANLFGGVENGEAFQQSLEGLAKNFVDYSGVADTLNELVTRQETIGLAVKMMAASGITGGATYGMTRNPEQTAWNMVASAAIALLGVRYLPRTSAKLLTSEKLTNWLMEGTKMKPGGMGAHIGSLTAMIANETLSPDESSVAIEFLQTFALVDRLFKQGQKELAQQRQLQGAGAQPPGGGGQGLISNPPTLPGR